LYSGHITVFADRLISKSETQEPEEWRTPPAIYSPEIGTGTPSSLSMSYDAGSRRVAVWR